MIRMTIQNHLRNLYNFAKREPLVHFLLLGLILFAVFELMNGTSGNNMDKQIVVNRDNLRAFIQSRQANLDDANNSSIETMAPAEFSALIDEYVREETMYREASSLGLDEDDYLIRRRLVQSLEFLFRSIGEVGDPQDEDLNKFYSKNSARYSSSASITFSHIYFSSDIHGWDGAKQLADILLARINTKGEDIVLASSWPGDRFAYHLNYAERDKSFVASHFGPDMADQLFVTGAASGRWQGPLRSTTGFHLVRVERLDQNEQLPYSAVSEQVHSDLVEARKSSAAAEAYDRLREQYDIQIDGEIGRLMVDQVGQK